MEKMESYLSKKIEELNVMLHHNANEMLDLKTKMSEQLECLEEDKKKAAAKRSAQHQKLSDKETDELKKAEPHNAVELQLLMEEKVVNEGASSLLQEDNQRLTDSLNKNIVQELEEHIKNLAMKIWNFSDVLKSEGGELCACMEELLKRIYACLSLTNQEIELLKKSKDINEALYDFKCHELNLQVKEIIDNEIILKIDDLSELYELALKIKEKTDNEISLITDISELEEDRKQFVCNLRALEIMYLMGVETAKLARPFKLSREIIEHAKNSNNKDMEIKSLEEYVQKLNNTKQKFAEANLIKEQFAVSIQTVMSSVKTINSFLESIPKMSGIPDQEVKSHNKESTLLTRPGNHSKMNAEILDKNLQLNLQLLRDSKVVRNRKYE